MICELTRDEFIRVQPLLDSEFINLEVRSVVEGYNPGWIFVDNNIHPKTAMIWSKGIEGFYFIGDEDNSNFNDNIVDFIESKLTIRMNELNLSHFEFSGTSKKWDEILKLIFNHKDLNISKQFVFVKDDFKYSDVETISLSSEFTINKVDRFLIENDDLNTKFIEECILEWWDGFDKFYNDGLGFCILHKDEIVCSCITSFKDSDTMESHIVTLEEYRKQGLATIAVKEFINECTNRNIKLYWDCMEKNYGSRALATKHGYTKAFDYSLFDYKL